MAGFNRSAAFLTSNLSTVAEAADTAEEKQLAMVLAEYQRQNPFQLAVTATDINNQVLDELIRGIYYDATLSPVPRFLLFRYFMKGKGNQPGYHRGLYRNCGSGLVFNVSTSWTKNKGANPRLTSFSAET